MKLVELEPHWTGPDANMINGVTFQCPHCRVQRLGVQFKNPIGQVAFKDFRGVIWRGDPNGWTRTGESFENLTLSPSIDTTSSKLEFPSHWHGFITNGEVT